MEQFRQIGELVGSLKALMVLKHDIQINQRQCCLLFDMYELAFETISEEIKQNLKLDERSIKWKALEYPMKELHKTMKEGECYIKYCLDIKDWWGKAMSLHSNRDCIEFHIHNLLCCFPVVLEAIESAAEISGQDEEVMLKRRAVLMKKYETEWSDPNLFLWMLGKQFLLPREICTRLDSAWKEDRWLLLETIREKKNAASGSLAKHETRLSDLLHKKLNGLQTMSTKLLHSSVLVGASDYYVKRRLGTGQSHIKEIQWLGENFALKTFYGDIEPLLPEISLVLSLSHPNTLQYYSGFYDEERKEGFLVMELMQKNLDTYIKENCGHKKRVPFSLPVAVDIMLQIARGMEYLHSQKIYHGELNPSYILLKQRSSSNEGNFHAKVTGFGLTSIKNYTYRATPKQKVDDPVIWYAPEVLAEQEQPGGKCNAKYTEKADVYSFGMLCFELLTGKIPFEDSHLQGEKVARNIRAGERPLFPYPSPKYLGNLTRKCWQSDPSLRPSFSSICRILRYIKKILIINPDHGQPESPPPLVDYCDIETGYSKKFSAEMSPLLAPVTQIPFQLFMYRLIQKEKIGNSKDKMWDLGNVDDHLAVMDDLLFVPSDRRSVCSEIIERKNSGLPADQRSSVSEVPHRRLFESDQRSICSESPRGRYLSLIGQDQRSIGLVTPERKFPSTMTTTADQSSSFPKTPERITFSAKKKSIEIPEKETLPTVPDLKFASPRTPDTKPLILKAAEQIIASTDVGQVAEKKAPITTDPKQNFAKKLYSRMRSKKLSDIPEFKDLSPSPDNSEKKSNKNDKKPRKPAVPKRSEKKESVKEKPYTTKTMFKTTDIQGTSKDFSPRNSPARIFRQSALPTASPGASPARIFKPSASPAPSPGASPARSFMDYSSRRYSTSTNLKGYLSPRNSPLNPCTRCIRHPRETSLHNH